MHYSTLLLTFTAICATSACFQSGANWGDHGEAKHQLAEACKALKGFYHVRDHFRNCQDSDKDPNKSYVFEVTNKLGHDGIYDQAACERDIGGIIDHCGHGGDDTQHGWQFRGDPNKGRC